MHHNRVDIELIPPGKTGQAADRNRKERGPRRHGACLKLLECQQRGILSRKINRTFLFIILRSYNSFFVLQILGF